MNELTARNSSPDEIAEFLQWHADPVVALFARNYLGTGTEASEFTELRERVDELENNEASLDSRIEELEGAIEDALEYADIPEGARKILEKHL